MELDLFTRALQFATVKHSGQYRRTRHIPYIMHPLEVACIISTMTTDAEVIVAGLLHDTVEDTDATMQDILDNFGERVAKIVSCETEDQHTGLPAEATWQMRKEESLQILKNTDDLDVKMLWLGDKLSNIRSFYAAYLEKGDALWQNFHQKDPAKQAWYYRSIAKYLSDLKDFVAYKEFVSLVELVFANVKEV